MKLNGKTADTYTYNETGAVVTHNNETYTYNEWDKLSGYTDGENTYTYKYDANGIRTAKNDKQYIIDINNNVVAETDSTGEIADEILWGHQPLARKVNGNWYYYIYNAHGDVIGLVDDSGAIVNSYQYDPWGNILSETETVANPIKYAGEYYDDELGMYYLRARYYDPTTGRFTQQDPAEDGYNWYVYGNNNPVMYVDPSGENAASGILANSWMMAGGAASLDGPLPFGDIIGVGIGVIGTAIAGGMAIHYANKDDRLTGNPGDVNVDGNKETVIGSDGRATKERHHTDHGNPSKHTNPHDHDVRWDSDGNPNFGPPINYPNKVPRLFGGISK